MVEGPIVKLSGDPDVDEDERLKQIEGETLLYDVHKGSCLSVALSLDETYAANEHDEDYIAVPAKVLLVAIGIVYSKEELKWYGQDSVLSPHRLNAIAWLFSSRDKPRAERMPTDDSEALCRFLFKSRDRS